jgi:hypothetical protein
MRESTQGFSTSFVTWKNCGGGGEKKYGGEKKKGGGYEDKKGNDDLATSSTLSLYKLKGCK